MRTVRRLRAVTELEIGAWTVRVSSPCHGHSQRGTGQLAVVVAAAAPTVLGVARHQAESCQWEHTLVEIFGGGHQKEFNPGHPWWSSG